jgi:hypothetical protein
LPGDGLFAPIFTTDELIETTERLALWDRPTVERLLDPSGYLGATDTWIDRALGAHQHRASETGEP